MKKRFILCGMSVLVAAFFISGVAIAVDERLIYKAGPLRNSLIELYTSDASPNGNPALEWMSSLKEKASEEILWKKVVPIALHAHVWDVSGYKDAFGRPAYDERLLAYKKKWNANNVYCPTMIVNGVEWSGWSRQQAVPPETKLAGTLLVDGTKREGYFEVSFEPDKLLRGQEFTAHAALVAFGLKSKPSDGKNRGKSLRHDFISMIYKTQDFRSSREGLTTLVELSRPRGILVEKYAVVFWVTKKGDILPLQATGGYLPA